MKSASNRHMAPGEKWVEQYKLTLQDTGASSSVANAETRVPVKLKSGCPGIESQTLLPGDTRRELHECAAKAGFVDFIPRKTD